jgi:hypothetical protein
MYVILIPVPGTVSHTKSYFPPFFKSRATQNIHRIPRFGHSRIVASIVAPSTTTNTDGGDDYKDGVRTVPLRLLFNTPSTSLCTNLSHNALILSLIE